LHIEQYLILSPRSIPGPGKRERANGHTNRIGKENQADASWHPRLFLFPSIKTLLQKSRPSKASSPLAVKHFTLQF
jgi:hypothetical protein